jgi:hypothetical protein
MLPHARATAISGAIAALPGVVQFGPITPTQVTPIQIG